MNMYLYFAFAVLIIGIAASGLFSASTTASAQTQCENSARPAEVVVERNTLLSSWQRAPTQHQNAERRLTDCTSRNNDQPPPVRSTQPLLLTLNTERGEAVRAKGTPVHGVLIPKPKDNPAQPDFIGLIGQVGEPWQHQISAWWVKNQRTGQYQLSLSVEKRRV
ncbi:hypothetical protein [Burkholderia sp. MBR-1]|uniref:hypothetical protein n=1 Tax=Burkholderia sp. MBR-1 TaxID=2732364 RepID=UPI0015EF1AC0|nr:hypothetical protein [Burkholderia sp. MBR-1]QMI49757.1 hypothetical protein MBR110_30245 [Burkholderia sp. MBR-1]